MWKPSPRIGTLIVLSGLLALGSVACNNDTPDNPPSPPASPVPKSQAPPTPASPPASKLAASALGNKPPTTAKTSGKKPSTTADASGTEAPTTSDTYQQAIDVATGAAIISQSAVSRDDWNLVASQWQQAIQLLKAVPNSSSNHPSAQKKLTQYQGFLAEAKQKATPLPKKTQQGDINPQFFSVPIKGRIGGIPIIEVSFNGTQKFDMLFDTGATNTLITVSMAYALKLKRSGLTKITIADGSQVVLPVTSLKSMEVDGRLKRQLTVSVAPPAMPIGLLGQDFYEGYDVSIKENVIEFRRR
jgi:predicted aspartyl protease